MQTYNNFMCSIWPAKLFYSLYLLRRQTEVHFISFTIVFETLQLSFLISILGKTKEEKRQIIAVSVNISLCF